MRELTKISACRDVLLADDLVVILLVAGRTIVKDGPPACACLAGVLLICVGNVAKLSTG